MVTRQILEEQGHEVVTKWGLAQFGLLAMPTPQFTEVPEMSSEARVWDIWYPAAVAQRLPFARGRLDVTDVLLVHAAPDTLDVVVRSDNSHLLAQGKALTRTAERPMARLTIHGGEIEREDLWPDEADIGRPVILPGGEVGILLSWWNAVDGSEWRWQVEFYNHR